VHKVSDCARFFPCKPVRHGQTERVNDSETVLFGI